MGAGEAMAFTINNNDYDADGNLVTLQSSGIRELVNLSRRINLQLILSSFVANIYL